MRANALLNKRNEVSKSDLYLYDLIHPLFLNSMGELGLEERILALFRLVILFFRGNFLDSFHCDDETVGG